MTKHPSLDTSRPRLMGILNTTPDSFSDGGLLYQQQQLNLEQVKRRVEEIVADGADIIDVGGESTRPGAATVSLEQELERVVPVVEIIRQHWDVAISVDSSRPEVMAEAASVGAHLLNDVRALTRDGALEAAAASGLPVCLMHMQGTPESMQNSPTYREVVSDVCRFLSERIDACRVAGIDTSALWLDPGFGFGKTLEHNLQLLRYLPDIVALGYPVLVGVSRKSMVGQLLGRELPERLPGSLALAMMALERGAGILRVHDVAATRDIIDTYLAVKSA